MNTLADVNDTTTITLADGSTADLAGFDQQRIWTLQFEQEQQIARQILAAPKGSPERHAAVEQGYDTICQILGQLDSHDDEQLVMGFDQRYLRLVLSLLGQRQYLRTGPAALFEIGYGCGAMLARVADAGYDVAGIEVSAAIRAQALEQFPPECRGPLYLGNFLTHELGGRGSYYDVVYWNDVLEHIPPDEAGDYLVRIRELLRPGGCLVTISPNWHERPSDVTGDFCPPRTEAAGLHLKEYTLREVTRMLRSAGFSRVETPLVVLPSQIVLAAGGLAGVKRFCEPSLELLPFRLAELLCHGLGLSYTIAHR